TWLNGKMLRSLATLAITATLLSAQPSKIADKTANAKKLEGYFNLYWDDKAGKPGSKSTVGRLNSSISAHCRLASAATTSASIAANSAAPTSCDSNESDRRFS